MESRSLEQDVVLGKMSTKAIGSKIVPASASFCSLDSEYFQRVQTVDILGFVVAFRDVPRIRLHTCVTFTKRVSISSKVSKIPTSSTRVGRHTQPARLTSIDSGSSKAISLENLHPYTETTGNAFRTPVVRHFDIGGHLRPGFKEPFPGGFKTGTSPGVFVFLVLVHMFPSFLA